MGLVHFSSDRGYCNANRGKAAGCASFNAMLGNKPLPQVKAAHKLTIIKLTSMDQN
jgi:hypothetical protein